MYKIVALVVTYNRKELLKENIKALLDQSYNKFDILVVDNASTDGTDQYIKKIKNNRVIYKNTGANLGGAGGFHFGIKNAIEMGYDYCWLMDDDTIPTSTSLEVLVNGSKSIQNDFSFICSYVKWVDESPCKMNRIIHSKDWYESSKLLNEFHLLKVQSCSFVSVFINLDVAVKAGLPVRQMFIYGDDHEYTKRLSREKNAYFSIDSVVVHKMGANQGYEVWDVPSDRISRYYYDSRNRFYRAKHDRFIYVLAYFYWMIKATFKNLFASKDKKLYRNHVIWKGFFAGIFFNPKIEYANKKNVGGKK